MLANGPGYMVAHVDSRYEVRKCDRIFRFVRLMGRRFFFLWQSVCVMLKLKSIDVLCMENREFGTCCSKEQHHHYVVEVRSLLVGVPSFESGVLCDMFSAMCFISIR